MSDANITIEDLTLKDPASKGKVIAISGQLDESNVDEKAKEIYKVLEENPGKLYLVMDLDGLEYMNSKSIGYLTDFYSKVTEKGGKLVVARAKANIKDILQVVGLNQLITMYDSLDEAKAGVETPAAATAETPATPPAAPEAPVPAEPVTPTPAPAATPAPVVPEAPVATPTPEVPATPAEPTETFDIKQ